MGSLSANVQELLNKSEVRALIQYIKDVVLPV